MASFPYAFSPKGKTGTEFVRVLKRLSSRLRRAQVHPGRDPEEGLHEIRTSIKLLRALLWFAKPVLPPTTYAYAKIQFQNAAHLLAGQRDTTAMRQTLKAAAKSAEADGEKAAVAEAGQALSGHEPKGRGGGPRSAERKAVALVEKTIHLLIHSAAPGAKWKSSGRRLRKARKQADNAEALAGRQPTAPNLHEWRKKAKRLFLLLQVLEPRPGKKVKRKIEGLDKLQHRLGDHHDAVVLAEWLSRDPHARPEFEPLLDLLRSRQKRLHRKARKAAKKL